MKTHVCKAASALLLAAWFAGCGDLERSNPFDPAGGVAALREQLVGTWSHESADRNELYFFRADAGMQLWDFSSPSGGPVDRNAAWPDTRVRIFTGTYQVTGKLLGISFTQVQSSDPEDEVSVPPTTISVEIAIRKNTLTFDKPTGKVHYTRQS